MRVDAELIKSPTGRLVLQHWADARPAWLWSDDGETLLWRNDAARYFHGKIKKHGVKLSPETVPIRGQIARLIRLGSMGRPSLSRIQFLAGDRPVSCTCTCTPLPLEGRVAVLLVGVDPIDSELIEARDARRSDAAVTGILPPGAEFLLISEDGAVADGSPRALERYAPLIESEGLPHDEDVATVELDGETMEVARYTASPHEAMLLVFSAVPHVPTDQDQIARIRAEEGVDAGEEPVPERRAEPSEPMLPLGLPSLVAEPEAEPEDDEDWVERAKPATGSLASLFDRLADDASLYTPLSAADEHFAGAEPEPSEQKLVVREYLQGDAGLSLETQEPEASPVVEPTPDVAADPVPAVSPTVWRVVGHGYTPLAQPESQDESPVDAEEPPDAETVERVSRYNFDELSRILTDRVNGPPARQDAPLQPSSGEGALINLAGETFILNRLPLGILVFRDQQVLFANRALTELTGYDSVDRLRSAGLTAIFPSEASDVSGPVTHLLRRDGSLAPVTARLQSITWQGGPALMLSASMAENRIGHEAAVRSFAELAAEASDDGFIACDRSGTVTEVSLHGRIVLGMTQEEIVGRPVAAFVDPAQLTELKAFLERPARFAETARPAIQFVGANPNVRITLFAEGQAGIVAGYFAFVRKVAGPTHNVAPLAVQPDDVEPSMLARISRGIRRPLNTVVGFSDLIRSSAFGPIENQRYLEYARDIRTAGLEINTLVNELDDYSRLKEGTYPSSPDEVDLAGLLESCLVRVRRQANDGRVLVRSAVSELLPPITADRASLTQAVLNLLASAIDQTPPGGSVILSAQREDDGAIVVNVRDGGEPRRDLGERFVVFRDGVGKDGESLQPVRSSVGLALTRSLLAVNALRLSVDPVTGVGNLFSLLIPAELVRD